MATPDAVLHDMTRAAALAGVHPFSPYAVVEIREGPVGAYTFRLVDGQHFESPMIQWGQRGLEMAMQRCALPDVPPFKLATGWTVDHVENWKQERALWLAAEVSITRKKLEKWKQKYRDLKDNVDGMVREAKRRERERDVEQLRESYAYQK